MSRADEIFLVVVLGMLIGLVVAMVGTEYYGAVKRSECYALGYPAGKLDVNFNAYCLKSRAVPDIIVPLEQAIRESRGRR